MTAFTVAAGTTQTARITMSGATGDTLTVAATGALSVSANAQAVRFTASADGSTIDNSGTIEDTAAGGRAIRLENTISTTVNLTINNIGAGSIISGVDDAIQVQREADESASVTAGLLTLANAGQIRSSSGDAIDFNGGGGTFVINITNSGIVTGGLAGGYSGADGLRFGNSTGTLTNNTGGAITGDRHGVDAGETSTITVVNETGATLTGNNGSGVGSDGTASVTNRGTITGAFDPGASDINGPAGEVPDGTADGDGDGIDIDGQATIENFGLIQGTGAGGHGSDGLPNTSEGIAAGGGTFTNHTTGTIRGVGLGMLIDDSSQGNALFQTTVTNDGIIEGTNNLSGIGIKIISNLADTIDNSGSITGGGGTAILFGTGDNTLNIRTGSVINGTSDGGAGTDTLDYSSFGGAVTVTLGAGTATGTGGVANFEAVIGGAGVDNLTGSGGNDLLNGQGGDDVMTGGTGNDSYVVNSLGDTVNENSGAANGTADRISTSLTLSLAGGSGIEILTTTDHFGTSVIDLTGNAFDNSLYGNRAANTLNGGDGNDILVGSAAGGGAADTLNGGIGNDTLYGGGADQMNGGAGDDTYYVRDNDIITEAVGEGNDRALAATTYALAVGAEVETLSTTNHSGTSAINLTGSRFDNAIYGNLGANTLNGGDGNDILSGSAAGGGAADTLNGGIGNDTLYGGGADQMNGGADNDIYYVRNNDVITESVGGGNDRAFASTAYTLAAGAEVETLTTTDHSGTSAINLSGNEFGQLIVGDNGVNQINGGGGNDTLIGNAGADVFLFNTTPNAATNCDTIADFVAGSDKFNVDDAVFTNTVLGTLAAGSFVLGTTALDADDRVLYDAPNGRLFFDADGVGAGTAEQFAIVLGQPNLSNTDFVVV